MSESVSEKHELRLTGNNVRGLYLDPSQLPLQILVLDLEILSVALKILYVALKSAEFSAKNTGMTWNDELERTRNGSNSR